MSDPITTEGQLPDDAKSAPADRATAGPLDESEANAVRPMAVSEAGLKGEVQKSRAIWAPIRKGATDA